MPRNLYTRALQELGLDVTHAQRVLAQRHGPGYESVSEAELYSTLSEYASLRGGTNLPARVDPVTGMSQATALGEIMGGPVARQMAKVAGMPLEPGQEAPAGHFIWGSSQTPYAYPGEALGYSLGYTVSQGQITTGAPAGKEKFWRQAGQQGPMAWFENAPVTDMGILAQGSWVPEPVQQVQAMLSLGPVGPEGTGYFDPNLGRQTMPFRRSIMLPQSLDPTTLELHPGMNIPTRGDPKSLFPGHTGMIEPQFQSAELLQWDIQAKEMGGKMYNELILQGRGYFPQGADFPQKFGVKTEAVAMPGLQEQAGVQYIAPMRDPMQAVANIVGSMSPEQRQQTFGREISRWEPGLYQEALEKHVIPNLQEQWLPTQTYQSESPITQELLSQGALRSPGGDIYGADVTGAFQAQRRTVGIQTPFGIQPGAPWAGRRDVLSFEVMRDVQRVHGREYYQHLEEIAAPRRAALEQVGGAFLANTAPEQSQFLSVGAGQVGWETAYATVQEQLAERGIEAGKAAPGMVGQLLMRAVAEQPEVRGKGIAFPTAEGGQIVMPNPGAVERWGGNAPVEGMPWGFAKRYGTLMERYLGKEGAGGGAKYELALQEAYGGSTGSLTEVTQSAAFRRALLGAPIGSARMSGRFAPLEALPENRWFTGREALERGLAPHVGKGVDVGALAEDIISGREAGPRMMFMRNPLTAPEAQIGTVLGFMSFPEAQKLMPGLTREKYEQMGASVQVSDVIGPAQGGDWDRDAYEAVLGTRYFKGGMEHIIERSSRESIRQLAASHPAGEIESLKQKIGQITNVEQASEFLRGAERTTSFEEFSSGIGARAEGQASMGSVYSAFRRRLAGAVQGTSEFATQARNEAGLPYMTVQDFGKLEGPEADLQNMIMRLSGAKFGGMAVGADPENLTEEDLFNLRNPRYAMGAAFRSMTQWEGISPESRAVFLGGDKDSGKVKSLAAEISRYNTAGSMAERSASMKRVMQLATGQDKPSWEQWAETSPLGSVMYSGAAYRARGRQDYVEGTAMTPLAEQGEARQRLMSLFRKGRAGQLPLNEALSAIDQSIEQGVIAGDEAQMMRGVLTRMQVTPAGTQPTATSMAARTMPGGFRPPNISVNQEYYESLGGRDQAFVDKYLADQATPVSERTIGRLSPHQESIVSRAVNFGGPGGIPTEAGPPMPPAPPSSGAPPAAPPSQPPAGAGGGMPPGGGGMPPIMLQPPEGRGTGYVKWTGGDEEGWQVRGEFSPLGINARQKAVISAMQQYEQSLTKRSEQLTEAIDAGKTLTKEEQKYGRMLGEWSQQMRIASQTGTVEEMEDIQGAQGMLQGMGAESIAEYAGTQRELAGAGMLEQGGGAGGRLGALAGGMKRMMVGMTPFQMRRMWSMLGAPVFKNMIPAAAQAEAQGWQLTQMMGGATGGMPEGVAGGVMQWQAGQRQAQIAGGRAGYRAYGAGLPAMQTLAEAQGVFGPALGIGGAAGIGAFALGGAAMALPVGAGVAGAVGIPAAARYVASYGEGTAENALAFSQGPGIQQGLGKLGYYGGAREEWGTGFFERTVNAWKDVGQEAELDWVQEQGQRGQRIRQTALGDLSANDRMAALNFAAQQDVGGLWSGMDEGQRLQTMQRYTPYMSDMTGMTTDQLTTKMGQSDWWVNQAIASGMDPGRYAGMAGRMNMGAGGAEQLMQDALGQRGAYARREWEMAIEQFSPLTQTGASYEQIQGLAAGGPMQGEQARGFNRMMGRDPFWWSEYGQRTGQNQFMTVDPGTGMGVGTNWGGGILAGGIQSGKYDVGAAGQALQANNVTVEAQSATVTLGGGQEVPFTQYGLQDAKTQMQRGYQDWQYGFQMEGLSAQYQYTTGKQMPGKPGSKLLGMLGIEEPGQFGPGQWAFEDIGTRIQRSYQQQQFAFQGESLDLRDQQFQERMAAQGSQQSTAMSWAGADIEQNWGRQQTRFNWADQDLAFRGAQSSLQFGWQMQDLEEAGRYATGRERRQIRRQRDRATIQYGMGMGQLDEQRGRNDIRRRWAEEDYEKEKERQQQRRSWAESSQALSVKHHQQDMDLARRRLKAQEDHHTVTTKLQDRQRDAARDYWEYNFTRQVESTNKAKELQNELRAVEDLQLALTRAQQQHIQSLAAAFAEGGVFYEAVKDILSLADQNTGDVSTGGSTYQIPSASGYGQGYGAE